MAKLYFDDEVELYAHKAWETLGLEAPVDLGLVADRLGIEIHEREFVEQIDGVYVRLKNAPPAIAINCSYVKPLSRRRFTLAHEIGHHLLGKRVMSDGEIVIFDTSDKKKTMLERACDRFAVLLLMPEKLVREYYKELSYNDSHRVGIMAERFGVSLWAMKRRLRELGMPVRTYRRT